MNIGLPHGFIPFNTMAHRILVHMHHHGPMTANALAEDLRGTAREPLKAVSANLHRLHIRGFIYKVGRARVRGGSRSCSVYSLIDSTSGVERVSIKNGATRTRDYRAKKALKVPSVFNFRGNIQL
jgi:hypothetical protein